MKNKYPLCFCRFKSRSFLIRPVSVLFFTILFTIPVLVQAQNNTAEKEAQTRLEKTASEYFEQDNLTDAYPLYSQLLSLYPNNPNYRYRLGACMLYASANKKAALKYIQYALKQPSVENLAYYYMGRAFHLNYRFDEAISNYEKFEQRASSSELKKHPVKQLIEMCRNGKELLAASQPLDVLRKKQLNFSIFQEAYTMRSNGGVLIAEPEEFKTKIDKKNKLSGLMYLTPDKQEAFFASYGDNEEHGKDIYCIRKKPDGSWGAAESLGPVVNSVYDEDYPVYDAPRNTLYFASKGHNSMGGYDIFSSVYNDTTQTWSEPYNLDFPINTPDDDILLVPDTSGQIAFFASARSCPQGKIEVYKITLHLHPPGTLVVAGTVHNGPAPAFAVITVRDSATNKIVAVDTTQDGSYSLTLPQSGKYIFTVQDSAHKSQSKSLMLSAVNNGVAVEENIQLNAAGSLQINNGAQADDNSQLALQYIEREAKMDVNVDTTASLQKLLAQSIPDKQNKTLAASATSGKPGAPIVTAPKDTLPQASNESTGSMGVAKTIPAKGETELPAIKDTSSEGSSENNGDKDSTEVAKGTPTDVVAQSPSVKKTLSKNRTENNAGNGSMEVARDIPANGATKLPGVKDTSSEGSSENNSDKDSTEVAKGTPTDVASQSPSVKKTLSKNLTENNAGNGSTEVARGVPANGATQLPVLKDTSSEGSSENNSDKDSTEVAKGTPTDVVAQSPSVKKTLSKNPTENNAGNGSTEVARGVPANGATKLPAVKDTSPEDSTEIVKNTPTNGVTESPVVRDSSSQQVDIDNSHTDAASGTLSKTDSVKVAQLEENKQQLDDKAGAATDYANNKMEQARRLQARADNISGRQKKSDSVAILSEQAKIATEKAMEAYSLAANYKSESGAKQAEINKTKYINNSSASDAKAANTNLVPVSTGDLIRQQAEQVKADSVQLAADNAEAVKEVSELQQKATDFVTQAGQTNDAQQKVALLQQADDLTKSKDAKEEEIKENDVQLGELHAQYAWLNNKAKKEDSISIASNENATAPNTETRTEVQKEIDAYGVNKGDNAVSDTNPVIDAVSNENQVSSPSNDTVAVMKHTKHGHRKKNSDSSGEPGSIAVAASPANENVIADNSAEKSTSQNNNPVSEDNTNTNETEQAEVPNAPGKKDTNGINNAPAEALPDNNTTSAKMPAGNGNNSYEHPDTTVYYKQSNDSLLDSIADAITVPDNFSPGSATPNSVATSVQYTDTTAAGLAQKSQSYLEAATMLADTAAVIRNQAKAEPDKAKARVLYARADSINALAYRLNVKGNKMSAESDAHQYEMNAYKIKEITGDGATPSDKATIAQLKLKDAEDSYKKYEWEMDSANSTTSLAGRRIYMESAAKDLAQAVIKQQRAISIYFAVDSSRAAVAVNTAPGSHNAPQVASSDENRKTVDTSDANDGGGGNPSSDSPSQNEKAADNSPAKEDVKQVQTNTRQVAPVDSTSSRDSNMPSEKNNRVVATSSVNNSSPANSTSDNTVSEKAANDEPVPAKEVSKPGVGTHNVVPESIPATANTFTATKDINTSAYSETKPIPVDPSIPDGVVFGVQIGAFRKPIPPDLFKGFEPIMGLTTPEGLVRYIAGTFKTFEPAKNAAAKIRSMGYAGAFVVAFYKGKRITIKEALAMLGVSPAEQARIETTPVATSEPTPASNAKETVSQPVVSNTEYKQTTPYTGTTTIPSKKELIDSKRKDMKAIKDSIPPEATNINEVKGLVYTVQVGSFSKRKGFTRLQKIKHLYYWTSNTDGTVKYNSGIYTNVADARAARDIIVANTAVKDAFVTVYYQGKRITPAQAADLLSKGLVTEKSANIDKPQPQANDAPGREDKQNGLFASASSNQVIYTVRIASFTGKLPVDTVNKLLSYATEGIQPYSENGVTIYYAGALADYETAEALRQKFYNGGFSHARVEAFYKGKKISIEEAQTIKNK